MLVSAYVQLIRDRAAAGLHLTHLRMLDRPAAATERALSSVLVAVFAVCLASSGTRPQAGLDPFGRRNGDDVVTRQQELSCSAASLGVA
jgi:hypothetical protein